MTDREVMKMALEALDGLSEPYDVLKAQEALRQALAQPEQDAGKCGCGANLYIDENGKPCSKAQPEQEPTACGYDETVGMCTNNPCCEQTPVAHLWECIGRWSAYLASNGEKANLAPPEWLVDAVKAATAQPEQEPVAWMHPDGKNYRGFTSPLTTFMKNDWTPLYTAPPSKPKQKPVAYITGEYKGYFTIEQINKSAVLTQGMNLYTAPPSKPWVSLTDEEITKAYEVSGHYQTLRSRDAFAVFSLARAIEAKLKEKNNG